MTMPHLMNCPHSCEGWCLECVKELHEDFETAECESRRLRQERDELLPAVYAAEEWACGRITDNQFREVISDGWRNAAKGLELMSRLIYLEGEEKKLLDEIAYLKSDLERERDRFGPIDNLLSNILFAETTFDAGPMRSVEDVSIKLWGDGSGNLLVKISADASPGDQMLINRVFYTEYKYPFDTLEELRKMLANMDLLKSSHPELADPA